MIVDYNIKKIRCFLTTKTHNIFYSNLINFLKSNFDLTVITCEDVFIKNNIFQEKIKRSYDYKMLNYFLKKTRKKDILIIDELFGYWAPINIIKLFKREYILIIHNPKKFSNYDYSNIFKFIDSIFKKIVFYKAKGYIYISPTTKEYALKYLNHENIFMFPFMTNEKNILPHEKSIIIPGTLNNKKNIDLLIYALNKYFEKVKSQNSIKFKVLGKVQDENHKSFFRSKNIEYKNEFVDDILFEKEIEKSYFLLSIHKQKVKKHGITENYGISKESGILFDALRFNKKIILPKYFNKSWINNHAYFYDTVDDLVNIFLKINSTKKLENSQIIKINNDLLTDNDKLIQFLQK